MSQIIISAPSNAAYEDAEGDGLQENEVRRCEVPPAMHAWRLDRALAELLPQFSRAYWQQALGSGMVQLRGVVVQKVSAKVVVGDRLEVELRPSPQAQAFVAQPMDLVVVFEDADLLVINKPAGLVVHPAAGHWSGTLLNGLLAHHAGAAQLPRAGIVHRLDKDTSGLMLVGKTRTAVDALSLAIAERRVQREYLALVHGRWTGPSPMEVDQPIGRDPRNRLRMSVPRGEFGSAKAAQTRFICLDRGPSASLLACKLGTGRTHQIRVHAAHLGHPLVGDQVYGGRELWEMPRQALHATRLRLRHPTLARDLAFVSDLPADIQQALSQSGLHYNGQWPDN